MRALAFKVRCLLFLVLFLLQERRLCLCFNQFGVTSNLSDIIFSLRQDNPSASSVAAITEQLRQLLCATRPSVMLSCRPAQASEVKVRRDVISNARYVNICHTKSAMWTSVYTSVLLGHVGRLTNSV